MDLDIYQKWIAVINDEKGWNDEPLHFPTVIALCHSELSEALEEQRHGHDPSEVYDSPHRWGDMPKPEGVPIEFADVIIRILHACEFWGIDIEEALTLKLKYNETRPYRHGGLSFFEQV